MISVTVGAILNTRAIVNSAVAMRAVTNGDLASWSVNR